MRTLVALLALFVWYVSPVEAKSNPPETEKKTISKDTTFLLPGIPIPVKIKAGEVEVWKLDERYLELGGRLASGVLAELTSLGGVEVPAGTELHIDEPRYYLHIKAKAPGKFSILDAKLVEGEEFEITYNAEGLAAPLSDEMPVTVTATLDEDQDIMGIPLKGRTEFQFHCFDGSCGRFIEAKITNLVQGTLAKDAKIAGYDVPKGSKFGLDKLKRLRFVMVSTNVVWDGYPIHANVTEQSVPVGFRDGKPADFFLSAPHKIHDVTFAAETTLALKSQDIVQGYVAENVVAKGLSLVPKSYVTVSRRAGLLSGLVAADGSYEDVVLKKGDLVSFYNSIDPFVRKLAGYIRGNSQGIGEHFILDKAGKIHLVNDQWIVPYTYNKFYGSDVADINIGNFKEVPIRSVLVKLNREYVTGDVTWDPLKPVTILPSSISGKVLPGAKWSNIPIDPNGVTQGVELERRLSLHRRRRGGYFRPQDRKGRRALSRGRVQDGAVYHPPG